MVILNADHPDVEEFIWCKATEERKARALEAAGFDMDLDGKDSHSIQYQNANNSVRVTDDFMRAVVDDKDWDLKEVTTGNTVRTIRARDSCVRSPTPRGSARTRACSSTPRSTAGTPRRTPGASTPATRAASTCTSTTRRATWRASTCSSTSARTRRSTSTAYKHTVEVMFTAQEILVGNADYPTPAIGDNSRKFRQLGLGYANLGALLMAEGLPYDSPAGRAWAGALTALMTGHAYATSARTAGRMGPFAGYAENADAMLSVLRMHRTEASKIDEELVPPELLSAAQQSWDEAVELGEQYGVRNSQATVLAPTGTIGLMMDCDTTGIEPDLALMKAKKLVGGGTMFIVNQTIPRTLRRLGYTASQIEGIINHIDEAKTIIGAPGLRPGAPAGVRLLDGRQHDPLPGHVTMMGAVQPFISGAISKTVNMPEEATVEEVEQLHIEAWRLGLKAVALYRDNCKVGQPLSTQKKAVAARRSRSRAARSSNRRRSASSSG